MMKKRVSLFTLSILASFAFANERGHFFVDLTTKNISLNSITSFAPYVELPSETTFELFRDTTDEWGIRHQSYQQYFNGNIVQSKMILVHSSNGKVRYIHGAVMDKYSAPETLTETVARKSATANAHQQAPEHEYETIIFCLEGKYYYVYKVQSPKSLETLYIDITSGNIIYRESAVHNADVTMRGLTRYQGWQNMAVYEQDGKYLLQDNGRNMVTMAAGPQGPDIMKYINPDYMATLPPDVLSALGEGLYDPNSKTFIDAFSTYVYYPMLTEYITQKSTIVYSEQSEFYTPVLITDASGAITIETTPSEYCDIHWGMQKTLDFYLQKFNRSSYDGKGAKVINLAFPPYDDMVFKTMPNNAAAQHTFQPYFMYYGMGDGDFMNPVVSIDIMSHEFTHMVTNCNGNGGLDYKEESGALNESFSDCLAMAVTEYATGTCPWTIGAEVMVQTSNVRSMSNPKNSADAQSDTVNGAQPDTYKGQCWSYIPAAIDLGQEVVHRNSGVMNHWFYILSEGKSGVNDNQYSYNVTGIGLDKATAIAYRNLIYYLTPCATYTDARLGSLMAAADLYGTTSVEYTTVANAWDAVGVEEPKDDEDIPTSVDVLITPKTAKLLRNGQVLIIRNGVTYNLMGQIVE